MCFVNLNFWKILLCFGLFLTAARSAEEAYFKMKVTVDGPVCDEQVLSMSTTVIGFLINKTESEIWRCSENCTLDGTMKQVACLFIQADKNTIAQRVEIGNILSAIPPKVAAKFNSSATYAYSSTFEYINKTSNLTEHQKLQEIVEHRSNHGTQTPSSGYTGSGTAGGVTSPTISVESYFKVRIAIDKPCDEKAFLAATNRLRSVLQLNDKKIWRCSENCTLESVCSDGDLTLCLFFEADEYTRTHSVELNASLSVLNNRTLRTGVNCGTADLVSKPSNEFDRLQALANTSQSKQEAQTGGGPGTGTIVGGTVGGLSALTAAILAGWGILRKLIKNQVSDADSASDTTPITPTGINFDEAPNSVPPAGI